MDWDNLALLEERCPPALRRKLGRLTEHCSRHDSPVVPDPYAGGAQASRRCSIWWKTPATGWYV